MKVTLLHGVYKKHEGQFHLVSILDGIKQGIHSPIVLKVKAVLAKQGKRKYQQAKTALPCFTPSGRFWQGYTKDKNDKEIPAPPSKSNIIEYNGIVALDYDGLEMFELLALVKTIKECPFVFAAFYSPSGNGYKVLVKTSNNEKAKHVEVFNEVETHFKELTGVKSDQSSKNYNRLCFVSVDTELHLNKEAETFDFKGVWRTSEEKRKEKEAAKKAVKTTTPYQSTLGLSPIEKAISRADKKGSFVSGNRHEYVLQYAVEAFKYGIDEVECSSFADTNFVQEDFSAKEVASIVKHIYNNPRLVNDKGMYAKWAEKNRPKKTTTKKEAPKPSPIKQKKEYEAKLFQESKASSEGIIELEEIEGEALNKLDKAARSKIWGQQILEDTLNKVFDFRINVLKHREEYKQKGWTKYFELDKKAYNSVARRLLLSHGVHCTVPKLESIILSDFAESVNPLKQMFENCAELHQKETTDWIDKVASLVATDAPKGLFNALFKKWMVASVANVYVDSQCTNHHCLILCSPEQGTNKTTFLTSLFSKDYTITGHLNLKNRDGEIALTDTFLVILDDQFSLFKKEWEWEALKSLITLPRVKVRLPYAKQSKAAPRISNFCGTTNRIEILQDDTGNRRFLPFHVTEPIDLNTLRKIDLSKMWAQAYKLYKEGWRYLPTRKEQNLMDNYQRKFKKLNTEHYLITEIYEPCDYDKSDIAMQLLSSNEIWAMLHKNYTLSHEITQTKIGRAMQFLGFIQKNTKRGGEGKKRRFWAVKAIT